MAKHLMGALISAILISGCGENGSKNISTSPPQSSDSGKNISMSPPQSSEPVKPKKISAWTREFKVDPFDDKKKTLSFQTAAKEGAGYLLLLCEDNRIKFFWQYALSGKGPGMGMDMELTFRLDGEPTFNQDWGWSATQPLFYPKGDKAPFLNDLIGKSKLAVKSTLIDSAYGVFDVSGFDEAYTEVKTVCPSQ
jgi:hypothetical protein